VNECIYETIIRRVKKRIRSNKSKRRQSCLVRMCRKNAGRSQRAEALENMHLEVIDCKRGYECQYGMHGKRSMSYTIHP
jgi:hypothetical protein